MVKPCFDLFLQVIPDAVALHDIPAPLHVLPGASTFVCAGLANGPASPEQAWILALPRALMLSQPPVGSVTLHLFVGFGFRLPFLIPQTTWARPLVTHRQ